MATHRAILLLVSFTVSGLTASADAAESLRGDAEAIERVERLLDLAGGADLWARSRQLHIVQHGWFTAPTEAAVETIWRSLDRPTERQHIVGRHTETTHIVTEDGAWTYRKGVVTEMPPEQHARTVRNWLNGSYTMLYRLARADQKLFLRFEAPYRVLIYDENDEQISWYEINEYGHLMKWGTRTTDGTDVEYVYGPPKDYGNLRFAAWGAATDASWRYRYEVFELLYEPMDPERLRPPN